MKWIMLLGFGTISLVFLYLGTVGGLEAYGIYRAKLSTSGTVIDWYVDHSQNKPEPVLIPVVEFITKDNAKVRFRARDESEDYAKGATVNVLYDRNKPENASIGSYNQLWRGPLFTGGIGILLSVLSIVLFTKMGSFEKALRLPAAGM